MDDIGDTGGGREASEFNSSGSQFTRRGLLQGAAASPVLLSSAAWALVPVKYELTLSLSQNDRLLTIVERPIFDAARDSKEDQQKNPTWFIHAVLFGPKAWFDLTKPPSDNHRTLKIYNCKFGDHTAEFTFEFSRKDDKAPWFIDFFTSFWNSAEREPASGPETARISFAEFVACAGKEPEASCCLEPDRRRSAAGFSGSRPQRASGGGDMRRHFRQPIAMEHFSGVPEELFRFRRTGLAEGFFIRLADRSG